MSAKMCCARRKGFAAMKVAVEHEKKGHLLRAFIHYNCAVTHLASVIINEERAIGPSYNETKRWLQECINRITELSLIMEREDDAENKESKSELSCECNVVNDGKGIDPDRRFEVESRVDSQDLRAENVCAPKTQVDKALMDRVVSTVTCRKPKINFSNVCGLDVEKKLLNAGVVMPMMFPESFNEKRTAFKAFLLFGPPGTGKSFIAEAVAGEAIECTFFSVRASDLTSKYHGESEQLVKNLFTVARMVQPSIIFIDEIDSLMMSRMSEESEVSRRSKNELLSQMEGVSTDNSGVFFMAATNTPQQLDTAFLQHFDKLLYIPLPDENARFKMLATKLMNGDGSTNFTSDDISELSKATEGLSGSDVNVLCRKAQMMPVLRLEESTHFIRKFNESNRRWLYIRCSECDEEAIAMNWRAVPRGCLPVIPPITVEDAMTCATHAKPSTDFTELTNIAKFAEKKAECVEMNGRRREEMQLITNK